MKRVLLFSSIFMMAAAMNAWADACAKDTTYGAIKVETVEGNCVATLDPDDTTSVDIPDDVAFDQFVYDRNFKTDSYVSQGNVAGPTILTVCLPFAGKYAGTSLFRIVGIVKHDYDNGYSITTDAVDNTNDVFEAGVPYFSIANSETVTFTPTSPINTSSLSPVTFGTNNEWEFRGTYNYKKWEEGDSQIGHVYGFAAKEKDNVKAGQFVKVKAGAFIKPMRAYLYYNKKALARRGALAKATDDEDLPSTIEVVFKDKNGVIASIHRMDPVTGAITPVEGWYDMKGRKLDKKPTLPGTYFNNGEKVIIK